ARSAGAPGLGRGHAGGGTPAALPAHRIGPGGPASAAGHDRPRGDRGASTDCDGLAMRPSWYPLARACVRCYPPRWRARYEAELLDGLDQHHVTARTVLNLVIHAARARVESVLSREGGVAVQRLRPRLLVLVATIPLFAIAFISWFSTDEPL